MARVDLTEIAGAAAAEAGGLDPGLLGDHLAVVLDVAASGRRLTSAELTQYRRRGQTAAEAGVALRALVELHLSGIWRLWPQLPDVTASDPARVARAGAAVLRGADDGVAALTEGYQLARQTVVRRQDAARREFFDDLLSGRADLGGLVARAEGFGIDLAAPHTVAVVSAQRPFADATPIVGQLERAILGRRGDANTLVASKEGLLVVVFAAPDGAAVAHVTDRLTSTLQAAAGGRDAVGEWRIGLGRARSGPTGVRASFEEARDALDLAGRLGWAEPVIAASDLLVYQVVLRDRAAITDLIEAVLTPLARGRADGLLDTLGTYLDCGGNTAAAARELHLSVRAVSYRLARIAELTGHDPTDPAHRLSLHVATVGARLLDWPNTPLAVPRQ